MQHINNMNKSMTCRNILACYCYCQYLARKGEQRKLDIEFNKLGSINLLASQEAAPSHSRELQHFSKGLTLLPYPPLVPDCQVKAGEGRHMCNSNQNGAGGGADQRGLSV